LEVWRQMQDQAGESRQTRTERRAADYCTPLTNFDFTQIEEPDYDGTIKIFSEGDIVEGRVVKIDKDEVLVDIGYKSEGVIPLRELSIRYDVKPEDVVQVGETIEALVLQKEDKDGRLILSRKRAQYERSWTRLEECMINNRPVTGEVIEVVKGGLILDIGLRGFLPASLVDIQRVRELQAFLGTELECKIIEMDRNRNNVVLSRRAFLEDSVSERRKILLERLQKGTRVKGKVSSIVSFGAFVNLGGVDGLVHISELSWCHVEKPSEVVSVGDEVEVEILDVDRERERISLSLKNTMADPWEQLTSKINPGDIISGKVTKTVPFGAFVQIDPGIEGLIHISELAQRHVEVPEEVVQVGQEVQVKVIDIDIDRRRVSLSLRQAEGRREEAEEAAAGTEKGAVPPETVTAEAADSGNPAETEAAAESLESSEPQGSSIMGEAVGTSGEEEVREEQPETEGAEEPAYPEEPSVEEPELKLLSTASEFEEEAGSGEEGTSSTLEDIIRDMKKGTS